MSKLLLKIKRVKLKTILLSVFLIICFSQPLFARKKKKKPKGAIFLSDTASFVGESAYDNSSLGLSYVGDVNGDGFIDFAVGAPNNDDGGDNTGKVYLFFGGKNNKMKKGENLANAPVSYVGESKEDNAGFSVSGAGDVNGDGLDDFVIGARNNSQGGDGAGKVYLIFGKKDGWLKKTSLSEVFPVFIGEMEEDNTGSALAPAGDVNGDGFSDLLIGSAKNDEGGEDSGAIYIVWGHDGVWKRFNHLNRVGTKFIGENAYDQTGSAISMAGDIDGDGYDDIIFGSSKEGEGGKGAGAAYLIKGKKDGWGRSIDLAFADIKIFGDKAKAKFGFSVSFLGDINGDGLSDIGVGSPASSKGGKKIGRLSIFLGSGDIFSSVKRKSSSEDLFIVGQKKKDQFGYSLAYLGDINADGFDDFAVSSTRNSEWKKKAGKTYIFFGKEKWEKENSAKKANIGILGEKKRDYSGNRLSFIGDFRGDGAAGVMIGSDSNSSNGRSSGKTYIFFPFENKAVTSVKSLSFKKDKLFSKKLESDLGWGENLYIEAFAEDPDSAHRNKLPCMVKNKENNKIIIYLSETDKNSGVFRGSVRIAHTSSNRILRSIKVGSKETVSVYPLNFPKLKKTVGLKVSFFGVGIDDADKGHGNANKRIEVGETVKVSVTLVNYNLKEAENVTLFLKTENPNVKILNGKMKIGDIVSGGKVKSLPFVVQVKKDAPKNFPINFYLDIKAVDGKSWEDKFSVNVEDIYEIHGHVFDTANGRPIEKAKVMYGRIQSVLTDDSGFFRLYINRKYIGENDFLVHLDGYLEVRQNGNIPIADKKVLRNFSLSKRKKLSKADASFVGIDLHETAGYAIGSGGDVNGDGYDDILVGTWACGRGGVSAGCTYLVLGKKDGWGKRVSLSAASASFIGESPYDEAGRKVAIIQDINGDGLDDIMIGAPGNDENGDKAGKVYIIFGRATGWARDVRLSKADSAFLGEDPYDRLGSSIGSLGDINGDGLGDLGVGAWSSTDSGMDAGQSYIIYGRRGAWPKVAKIGKSDGSFVGERSRDESGRVVTGIGDVNGDGLDDFIIGAPASSAYKDFAGKAFLFFGSREDLGWRHSLAYSDASFLGEDANDSLGSAISYIGDVNGDGLSDFAFGAWSNDLAGKDAGKVYVVFGKKEGWKNKVSVADAADASFLGEARGDAAGTSVVSLGDFNGDGFDDFLISSPKNAFNKPGSGQVYIIFGHSGKWEKGIKLSFAQRSYVGMETNDYSGYSLANAGDINNDGRNDIVISSWGNDDAGMDTGQVYIFFGEKNVSPLSISKISLLSHDGKDLTDEVRLGQRVRIQAEGEDADPSMKNVAFAVLTDSSYVFDFDVPLLETGKNTGVFEGNVLLSETSASALQGRMKVNGTDHLFVFSRENPALKREVFIEDGRAPFLRKLFPLPGSYYIPSDIDIRFRTHDYGCNVNPSSLLLKINGEKVDPVIQKRSNGEYSVVYNPSKPFEYEKKVDVSIEVSDNCKKPNVLTKSYSFKTSHRGSFGNGGFEKGLSGWRIIPTGGVKIELDKKIFHSGKASCKIKFMGADDLEYTGLNTGAIPVRPKTKYSLIFWVKTKALLSESGIRVYLEGTNHPDRYFNIDDYFNKQSDDLLETNEWSRVLINFTTLKNTHYIIAYVVRWKGGGVLKGECWFDDFLLFSDNESGYVVPGIGDTLRSLF